MEGSHREVENQERFHVVHKIPAGDTPYVRAKHLQLVEKDLEGSIVWFWKAINAGDRVESALKDMAVVMKHQDRAQEAIEAIKSFRHLCSNHSQESLDNILIDLYKKCGEIENQIELIKHKLRRIYLGETFNGRNTKTARSHGKKFQVTVEQEVSRLLGNLGWAYMQKGNFRAAEAVYGKAQMIEADSNKAYNLALSLMKQGRHDDALVVLADLLRGNLPGSDEEKTMKRAEDLLDEIESQVLLSSLVLSAAAGFLKEDEIADELDDDPDQEMRRRTRDVEFAGDWGRSTPKRLQVFQDISRWEIE